jgi:hypothetical protein
MIYQTKNFFIGFDYPLSARGRGRVYLNGEHFANTYVIPPDWGSEAGRVALNRDLKALDMGFPPTRTFDTIDSMLKNLQQWYDSTTN